MFIVKSKLLEAIRDPSLCITKRRYRKKKEAVEELTITLIIIILAFTN